MRALAVVALAACGSSKPAPQPVAPSTGSATTLSTGSAAPADPSVYPPPEFSPPTTGLAVGIAAHVVIDDAGSRVFVRKALGIEVLALDTGNPIAHVDIGWEGALWPAGPNLLAMRNTNTPGIEVALVDPASAKLIARCSSAVTIPPASMISRVDEFTTHAGTTYLKWETSPPPRHMGGARISDEEMARRNGEFRAAYACGLLAIHASGARCTLDVATFKDAGLESCETRTMPWPRYLPTPIGKLSLRVDRATSGRMGLIIDTETLVVSSAGSELWRLPVETSAIESPPP